MGVILPKEVLDRTFRRGISSMEGRVRFSFHTSLGTSYGSSLDASNACKETGQSHRTATFKRVPSFFLGLTRGGSHHVFDEGVQITPSALILGSVPRQSTSSHDCGSCNVMSKVGPRASLCAGSECHRHHGLARGQFQEVAVSVRQLHVHHFDDVVTHGQPLVMQGFHRLTTSSGIFQREFS